MSILHHIIMSIAKPTPIPDYLCFTALEAGTFTLTVPAAVTSTYLSYVEYSLDGRNWTRVTIDDTAQTITTPTITQGGKVYWRGSGVRMSANYTTGNNSNFSSDCEFTISGHLLSLLKLSDYENMSGIERYTFCTLFNACSGLLSAEDLVLPSTCIDRMYIWTFRLCENMVKGPKLLAPDIPTYGYNAMFSSCRKLQSIDLSAVQTYSTTAFQNMCGACNSLNYVKCLLDPTISASAFSGWLASTSSTGTFIQAEGVTWPRGASGIPTGWVDIEKRTMPSGYKQVLGIYGNGTAKANINIGYAVNMKYDKIEVAFKQDEISNGMVLQSVPASGSANNGKCWFYNYNGSSLASKPFAIYSQKADGTQVLMTAGQIYQPLDTNPHYIEYTADGTNLTVIHNGTTKTSTHYVSDLPESCSKNTIVFGNAYYTGWIFYFRNSNGNTQLADYVACVRESDNAPGFWDFVSNSFQTSSDPTKFTAGEEI